jgi:hypothetical protein
MAEVIALDVEDDSLRYGLTLNMASNMNIVFQTFRSLLSVIAPSDQRSLEAYLSQAQTLAELEQRERQWHRTHAERASLAIGMHSR